LHQLYSSLVEKDGVKPDAHQLLALGRLGRLREELARSPPGPLAAASDAENDAQASSASSSSSFGSWLYSAISPSQASAAAASSAASPFRTKQYSPIRGVYLHGGVGCGKTFLANLLYDSTHAGLPGWKDECQKHHFHRFMLGVHQEMHRARYGGGGGSHGGGRQRGSDAIVPAVVDKIVRQGRFVYLDEFQGKVFASSSIKGSFSVSVDSLNS
jgi:predicted ATPase